MRGRKATSVSGTHDGSGYDSLRLDRTGQAEAFDAIGDRYDEAFPHKEGQVGAGDWLIESLDPGARVLDLGSGTGVPTARQLADAGFEVVGVDFSARMVALARGTSPPPRSTSWTSRTCARAAPVTWAVSTGSPRSSPC